MNVLAVLHYPMFGGPENRTLQLSGPFAERGVDLAVVLPDEPGNAAERFLTAGVPTEFIRLSRLRASLNPVQQTQFLLRLPGDVHRLRQIIRKRRIDVVVLAGLANPHAAIAAHQESRAVLWQIVDTRVPGPGRKVLMPLVERLSDTVMFWGEAVERLHTGGRTLAMPTFLGNSPVNLSRFVPSPERRARTRAKLGIPAEARVMGSVSNLNPQKGIEYFIRAAHRVAAEMDDVWFLIVGASYDTHRAYERRLTSEIREAGLSARFKFAGSATNVEDHYPAMDVKLITSVPASEGIPTTALEAMACAVPVVTTDVGSAREAVVDGATGYVVPALDDRAIAAATLRVLGDRELASRLGSQGRRRAEERYGIEPAMQLHLRAFETALAFRESRGSRGGSR